LTIADIRADLERLAVDLPALTETRAFSPEAYNAIGVILLSHTYDTIERIADEHGLAFHSNLAVMLFCDLHAKSCCHYFAEYERINGMQGDAVVTRRAGMREAIRPRARLRELLSRLRSPRGLEGGRVGFAGTTTFLWQELRTALAAHDLTLSEAPAGRPNVPLMGQQRAHLLAWAEAAHAAVAGAMGIASDALEPFAPAVDHAVQRVAAMPVLAAPKVGLMVTGTLGALRTRLSALNAISHGVPVLTIHHGGQFKTYDEPYYDLYEGQIPMAKVVYGDIDRQRGLGTLTRERTLNGKPTLLYARTDAQLRRVTSDEPIPAIGSLSGKSVLYLPTEMESGRYGPYRDVHPATYQAWQQRLIAWLAERTGSAPHVRLHPKRTTQRFKPQGFAPAGGPMEARLAEADVLVLDYPTTAFSLAAATNKPILFFDIGLRRLQPVALDAVRARCVYAGVDMLDPDAGLAAMDGHLGRSPSNDFSPLFSIAPNDDDDEVVAVAKAIDDAFSRLR
jgi:hypothetical protein